MKTRFFSPFITLICALTFSAIPNAAFSKKDKKTKKSPPSVVDQKKASAKIDDLVLSNLKKHKIKPNADIHDHAFVRRAYLDIAGRIPTIEESESFIASTYENKRERLIADLLASDAHLSHAYNYWADILRINRALGNGSGQGEAAYQLWLKKAIADNKPYDEFVRDLVSARGYIWGKRSHRLLPARPWDAAGQHVEYRPHFPRNTAGMCSVPQSSLR